MMNNHTTRILCVLGSSALLMGTAAVRQLSSAPSPVLIAAAETAAAEPLPASPAPTYLVREADGWVAVFSGDGSELLRMTDSRVSALPQGDRQRLRDGIPVSDDQSLAMLLEDYQ